MVQELRDEAGAAGKLFSTFVSSKLNNFPPQSVLVAPIAFWTVVIGERILPRQYPCLLVCICCSDRYEDIVLPAYSTSNDGETCSTSKLEFVASTREESSSQLPRYWQALLIDYKKYKSCEALQNHESSQPTPHCLQITQSSS